jgi:hypothetical protein
MADYYSPESICAILAEPRPEGKPDHKHATGKAGVDGYTAHGRRPRGDIPGEIVSKAEADRQENPSDFGYPMVGGYDYPD